MVSLEILQVTGARSNTLRSITSVSLAANFAASGESGGTSVAAESDESACDDWASLSCEYWREVTRVYREGNVVECLRALGDREAEHERNSLNDMEVTRKEISEAPGKRRPTTSSHQGTQVDFDILVRYFAHPLELIWNYILELCSTISESPISKPCSIINLVPAHHLLSGSVNEV